MRTWRLPTLVLSLVFTLSACAVPSGGPAVGVGNFHVRIRGPHYTALLPHHVGARLSRRVQPQPLHVNVAMLPDFVDNSSWDMPIGDQGQVGACVSWAIDYNMLGWYYNRQRSSIGNLTGGMAPMYTYAQISHGNDQGSSVQQTSTILEQQGIEPITEYSWGQQAAQFDYTEQPKAEDTQRSGSRKLQSAVLLASNYGGPGQGIGQAGQFSIEAVLASGNVGTITFPVYTEFMVNSGSPVPSPSSSSVLYGYHEVMFDGYNAQGLDIENQWGNNWGFHGHVLLTWDFIQHYVVEAWSFDTGLTPPQPTPTPRATATALPSPTMVPNPEPTPTVMPGPNYQYVPSWFKAAYRCTWWIGGKGCKVWQHKKGQSWSRLTHT